MRRCTAAAAAGNVPSPQELSAERNAPPIVPSDTNAARLAAWVAKNKNDYETNKNEGVTKFSSFPESYLQITTDKTKHVEMSTVFYRSFDDEVIVMTGRTQMNDCKFHKAVTLGKYPANCNMAPSARRVEICLVFRGHLLVMCMTIFHWT
jgi:hypothetical protein